MRQEKGVREETSDCEDRNTIMKFRNMEPVGEYRRAAKTHEKV